MSLMFQVNRFLPITVFALGTSASLQAAGDGGVSPSPYKLTEFLGLPVTNTILTTWVISLLLILGVRVFVGTPKLIPGKWQAVLESIIDGLKGLLEPIVGKKPFR